MSIAVLRPQLKDMHMCGMDALQSSIGGKKAKNLQPPANASPGELRLWRKLNGFLTEDEKAVDALEHNKAKSRANLAGRPRTSPARRRPSESEVLYSEQPVVAKAKPVPVPMKRPASPSPQQSPRGARGARAQPRARTTPMRATPASPRERPPAPTGTVTKASVNAGTRASSPRRSSTQPPPRAVEAPQQRSAPSRPPVAAPPRRQPPKAAEPPPVADAEEEAPEDISDRYSDRYDEYDQMAAAAEAAVAAISSGRQPDSREASARSVESQPVSLSSQPSMEDEYDLSVKYRAPQPLIETDADDGSKAQGHMSAAATAGPPVVITTVARCLELINALPLAGQKEVHAKLTEMIECSELQDMFDR